MRRTGWDPWLMVVLVAGALLGTYHLEWGLPNGNHSWAADSLGPLTVLGIARRSMVSWNSGWFYFKYPLGYPLLLLMAYVPYLGFLSLTGQFQQPKVTYPYGFTDPETALHIMALLGRWISVACIVATAALAWGIGRRLFGRGAGLLAAWLVATAYPVVYYGHTTNLDAAYLFWLTLALWSTLVAVDEGNARWPYVVLGMAATMAVSTKEQGFAFLLPLPVILAFHYQRALLDRLPAWRRWAVAVWNPKTRAGIAAACFTAVIANNVVFNPGGFSNRLIYLSGGSVTGVSARLAPVEFGLFKGIAKEFEYVSQLAEAIESSLGLPLVLVAVAGVMFVLTRHPRAALLLLTPAAAYYYLSLRTLDLIRLRYTLPLSVVLILCAAAVCARALASRWRGMAAVVVAGLCLLSLGRAVEVDLLLSNDSRYQAEEWMKQSIPPGSTIEVYQKPVYLPRPLGMRVQTIALEERTIEGLEKRRPEFIIVSSAAKKGITHRWNPDWRLGNQLLVKQSGAVAFLESLESERLAYRSVAEFSQQPVLLRSRITSMCPKISIYRRLPS